MRVKIADLKPHPINYNFHPQSQVQDLQKSLRLFKDYFPDGQYKNIVVCQNTILAGHGLVEAAKAEGLTEIDAQVCDTLPEELQLALLVADNALPFGSSVDSQRLEQILSQTGVLEIPGANEEWLEAMGATSFNVPIIDNHIDSNTTKDGYYDKTKLPIQIGGVIIFVSQEEQEQYSQYFSLFYSHVDKIISRREMILSSIGTLINEISNTLETD